jgi:V/A-type H+-transporting ATPase subunit F|tara:strand:+ start:1286 stop:1579 length:294 start_codon:yes stop_codon:yes gene_type:complete
MEIGILADQDTLMGFRVAGVTRSALYNPETLKEDLKQLDDVAILLVTEKVAVEIRKLDVTITPVLVDVPDKDGSTGNALLEIARLYEEAIGVKLKEN